MNTPKDVPSTPRSGIPGLRISLFSLAVIAMGMLLWARFIIVTNHPRTAIAEPAKTSQASPTPAAAPVATVNPDKHDAKH